MYNNNVHKLDRTYNTDPDYKHRTLHPGHFSSGGNTGNCKKMCDVSFSTIDTKLLKQPLHGTTKIQSGTRFRNDYVQVNPGDPNFVSANQVLAGPANPKTLIAPVVVPPITDLDHWRANNLINHSHINTETQWDTYLSGYEISNDYDRMSGCIIPTNKQVIENFEYIGISDQEHLVFPKCNPIDDKNEQIISPTPVTTINTGKGFQGERGDYIERYSEVRNRNSSDGYEGFSCKEGHDARDPLRPQHLQHVEKIRAPTPMTQSGNFTRENFEPTEFVLPEESGWVNTVCGYNPEQIKKYNLPSNICAGNCEKDDAMKRYNKNLFTQTIQPNVYTVNEIIEPINANIGISFTQQFEPLSFSRDERDDLTYTEHDPRVYQPKVAQRSPDMSVTESNIYDPRFSGYGTSYRAYTDNNIGQTRFYYDDIDSVRMPNYITRSNIDHINYSDTYGPLRDNNKFGNQNTSNIRDLVHNSFLQSSIQHRNDLMERLMRKRNSEMWQTRKYPMRTFGAKK